MTIALTVLGIIWLVWLTAILLEAPARFDDVDELARKDRRCTQTNDAA